MSQEIHNIKKAVTLSAAEAEYILGSLDALVKSQGMAVAAGALTVAHKIKEAFAEVEEAPTNEEAPGSTKKKGKKVKGKK